MDMESVSETKVPISSEDIADMIDVTLADKMQLLSINEVPIYNICWGNNSFTNPWENMFTQSQRRRYNNLETKAGVNRPIDA